MSLEIVNARLLDPATGTDAIGGVLIDKGVIKEFRTGTGVSFKDAKEALDANGLCLAPGLIDLRAKTGEPGEEHKETLATASRAALSGGITSLVVMPDTRPVIDDVALVQFIAERGRETAFARVYPAGGLTVGLAGEAMSEIGMMAEAGAVLFTNGDWPVASAQVMKRVMTYAASRGAIVMSRPDDRTLAGGGVMNAGEFAARNGLSGIPIEAEWLGAMRDVTLAEQTGCTLILDQVTSQRTLDIVDIARGRGAKVFTTVAAHSLFFNELDVGDYLTYCKVNPPFRTEQARKTLIAALKEGAVNAVVSAHDPQPPEEKRLPFGEASFGAAGLETVLPCLLTLVEEGELTLLEA
ncbi:MAG: dihydroorotase, partial [Hyphomonas sp.]|nr:dihydroorotase [Hyphomonas sp.]